MKTTTDNATRQANRENRHMQAALRQIAVKTDLDCGGILMPRQRPFRNRRAYSRNAFKRRD